MVAGASSRFACEACGKSFAWKPALAGKKAKCSCGAIMTVPQAPLAAATPHQARSMKPPPVATAQFAAPLPAAPAATLGYVSARRRPSEKLPVDKLIDPVRDIYVPTTLLGIGFIAILLWAFLAQGINGQLSMVVLIASSVSTAIKTTVLVLLAVALANQAGFGFGTFWPAVLKFSSTIILTDSMLEWFEAWMVHIGAIRVRNGVMYISIWLLVLEVFLAAIVTAGMLKYYFEMDHDEAWWVALGIATVSMIAGFVLRFLLVSALESIIAARTPPPAAAPAPAGAPTPALSAPAAPINETPHDKTIRLRIEQRSPFVQDGVEFMQRGLRGRGQKQLFERLTEAGVTKMYADLEGGPLTPKLYVELPQDPAGRAACFTAYATYCQDARAEVDSVEAKDTGQKYLVIQLKR